MFTSIPSLDSLMQGLMPAFTQPLFATHVEVFLGWVMCLVVDDTLLHKRSKRVDGLDWFRDPAASTSRRMATASDNHWIVVGLAICIPGTNNITVYQAHAMLHLPGEGQASEKH